MPNTELVWCRIFRHHYSMKSINYLFILSLIYLNHFSLAQEEIENFDASKWQGYSRRQRIENVEKVLENFTSNYNQLKTKQIKEINSKLESLQKELKQTQGNNFLRVSESIEQIKKDLIKQNEKEIQSIKQEMLALEQRVGRQINSVYSSLQAQITTIQNMIVKPASKNSP